MTIYWSAFSWEAFAALATGIMAVIAATYIGKRQLILQENQLEILSRQTRLTENDLKIQLLEKRTECVIAMREIVNSWARDARLDDDQISQFLQLLRKAELLFPKNLTDKIDDAVMAAMATELFARRSQRCLDEGDEPTSQEFLEKSFEHEDKLFKIMPDLLREIVSQSRIDAWQ